MLAALSCYLLFTLTGCETFLCLPVCLKAGLQFAEQELFNSFFFGTARGKPQCVANHPDWVASNIKASSPAKPSVPQQGEGWPRWSRKPGFVEVSQGKRTISGQETLQGLAVAQQIFLTLLSEVHF